jgi:hypothetical protein
MLRQPRLMSACYALCAPAASNVSIAATILGRQVSSYALLQQLNPSVLQSVHAHEQAGSPSMTPYCPGITVSVEHPCHT